MAPSFNEDTRLAFSLIAVAGFMAPVGAALGMLAPKGRLEVIPVALAFSAGVLIWVALVGLHPEALESFTHFQENRHGIPKDNGDTRIPNKYMWRPRMWTLMSIGFGLLIGFSHGHDDGEHGHGHGRKRTKKNVDFRKATELESLTDSTSPRLSDKSSPAPLLSHQESRRLLRVSLITALAITIHNLPEGIATFASTVSNPDLGVLVGVAVAMHNIPLGIAVGMPIFMSIPGKEGKIKAILAASCAGFSSLFGGFIAWLVFSGGLSNNSSGVVFGSVIGIMIWTAFKELLPQARQHDKYDKFTTYLVFIGFLVMDCSLVIFDSRGGERRRRLTNLFF